MQQNTKYWNRGGYFEELALNNGKKIYSIDPSEKAVEQLKERLKIGDNIRVGYVQNLPFESNSFDVVVISEVLEHLRNDDIKQGLVEIKRVLRTGGIILGTVPANEDLNNSIVICPKCGEVFHRWGHIQSFSTEQIKDILKENFCIKEISEKIFPNFKNLNNKGKIVAFVKLILLKMGIHGRGENIFFHAENINDD